LCENIADDSKNYCHVSNLSLFFFFKNKTRKGVHVAVVLWISSNVCKLQESQYEQNQADFVVPKKSL